MKEQLSEQARDSPSVADLVTQLETLQSQVAEAQQRAAVMVRPYCACRNSLSALASLSGARLDALRASAAVPPRRKRA